MSQLLGLLLGRHVHQGFSKMFVYEQNLSWQGFCKGLHLIPPERKLPEPYPCHFFPSMSSSKYWELSKRAPRAAEGKFHHCPSLQSPCLPWVSQSCYSQAQKLTWFVEAVRKWLKLNRGRCSVNQAVFSWGSANVRVGISTPPPKIETECNGLKKSRQQCGCLSVLSLRQ